MAYAESAWMLMKNVEMNIERPIIIITTNKEIDPFE